MSVEKITAEESRKIMNDFNFSGLYQCYDEKVGRYHKFEKDQNGHYYAKLQNINNEDIDDKNEILGMKHGLDTILKDTNFRCGIISNGNHGLDLLEVYNLNHEGDEIIFKDNQEIDEETRVMLVFDSPANNLKDCFAYDKSKSFNELIEKAEPKDFLCKHLWRSKDLDIDNCKKEEQLTGSKAYGQMVISFMHNYKIKNVYTTNLFRYEITAKDEENFVSLRSMKKRDWVKPVFEEIFLEEIGAFKPDIIVAVGKVVYNYLSNKTRFQQICNKVGKVELAYVYHPKAIVSRDEKRKRFDKLKDICCSN